MTITLEGGLLRVDLDELHEGPRVSPAAGSTAYLGKFGVITEWDGRGTLLGIAIPVPAGVQITTTRDACHDPAHA